MINHIEMLWIWAWLAKSGCKFKLKWVYSFSPHYRIPRVLICDWGGPLWFSRVRLLKRPTPPSSPSAAWGMLFFYPPLAPCVDALSAGCVLHVKQAADAVCRTRDRQGQEGSGTQGRPHRRATRLAHSFFPASPPQQHLSLLQPLPHFRAVDVPPLHHHPPDRPSATLLAHAVVCLLGNRAQALYGGTLGPDTHWPQHFNA